MKKNKIQPRLNSNIVEKFSNEEMIIIAGGKGIWAVLADILLSSNINAYCPVENSGNCVSGCACK